MLFLDTAMKIMIDKCCRFHCTTYVLMNMSAECAFCFLINLKNSRHFYIIKSSVSLFNQTANKDLIGQLCAWLECQAFSRSQLAGRGYTVTG
jgi:hypothetical protein